MEIDLNQLVKPLYDGALQLFGLIAVGGVFVGSLLLLWQTMGKRERG
jgi:hypothetical protein